MNFFCSSLCIIIVSFASIILWLLGLLFLALGFGFLDIILGLSLYFWRLSWIEVRPSSFDSISYVNLSVFAIFGYGD